ncbi:acyl-CoA dehydrogenase [Streptomyces sedi]|uniref:Acyl-CoA dehydrogenase n=1 Tax=Streptomyces sedi TaxID=555059 RepID=A0A5C4UQE2_9ACTN|nr:acyl-CoA dehydrogenase [Streptomyces sedi]TNM25752.1 acyl-CoA dehydrogenase [Streptomyces sedi]
MPAHPTAQAAVAELTARLGDPDDADNPLGHAAILAADEDAEILTAGERLLDDTGLNAEYVPAALGGRFERLDRLIDVARTVFRRDPTLGAGHGIGSFLAAVNIWSAGTPAQQKAVADLLLANGKLAVTYNELAHGNDLLACETHARRSGDTLLLNGRKEPITNAARAAAYVVFARTDPAPGQRSHSQLLVRPADVPPTTLRTLPRTATVGMRGLPLAGVEFTDCPLGDDAVVGAPGQGLQTALTSFQVTRIALPAVLAGALDTGLRLAVRHLAGRRLYGASALRIPAVRRLLAGAYADLLLSETVTAVAARGAHLTPGESSVHAAGAKYLVTGTLLGAFDDLATAMGAHGYLRAGDTAFFQKLLRDIRAAQVLHASRAACLLTLMPQLPLLATRSWNRDRAAHAGLFRPAETLPPLAWDRLKVTAKGHDHLTPALRDAADGPAGDEVTREAREWTGRLRTLADSCAALAPAELTPLAGTTAYDLAAHYASVRAAAATLGTWQHGRGTTLPDERWWPLALLARLPSSPRHRVTPLPDHLAEPAVEDLIARCTDDRPLGLARGWAPPGGQP